MRNLAELVANYPVSMAGEMQYVRTPIRIKESFQPFNCVVKLIVGNYVAVNVVQGGYFHLMSPNQFKTLEECEKACDAHNKYLGFSDDEADALVDWSKHTDPKEMYNWKIEK